MMAYDPTMIGTGAAIGAGIGGAPGAAIGAGSGALLGFFGPKRLNVSDLNKRYLSYFPEGLTQEDRDFAENQRSRAVAANRGLYSDARAAVLARAGRRGTANSPSTEANLSKLNEREGAGIERAGQGATGLLSRIRDTRAGARRAAIFRSWDKEVGAQTRNFDVDAERNASWWNSMGEFARAYASKGKPGTTEDGGTTGGPGLGGFYGRQGDVPGHNVGDTGGYGGYENL